MVEVSEMEISLHNAVASVTVNLFGGAITNFHLNDHDPVNPLSFAFTTEEMPENNRLGAPYRGHFLCAGRWGLPSDGEIKAGVPNHGEVANIFWQQRHKQDLVLNMETTAKREGLHVERTIQLDQDDPVFAVKETVTNIQPLGRLYNVVQHPTLASPFLDRSTIIHCNASIGFDQTKYTHAAEAAFIWPHVSDDQGNTMDLKNPQTKYNSVFSFVVDQSSEIGWITVYSPTFNFLFGYVWKRMDYPWIHLWQHWGEECIKYRGIEFGTAGIHQPFKEILGSATKLFGERTFEYIDAGECVSKNYFCFIYRPKNIITSVDDIKLEDDHIQIMFNKNESTGLHLSRDQL